MIETLLIPQPHSRRQELIMKAFFTKGLHELWVSCGTKFGKTFAGISAVTSKAWTTDDEVFRWVAPIYSQTKIAFRYARRILPVSAVAVNKSEPSITILKSDTRIEFKSGKFPEDLEGEACSGYGLDEAAKMSREVYDSAKTTTTVTKGIITAFSTPRGKNWFYTKCKQAQDEMNYAIRHDKVPSKIFLTAPSIINPSVTKEAIDEARRSLPDRLFRQYYLAEFVDDGSVFVGTKRCVMDMEKIDTYGSIQRWIEPHAKKRSVVIGVDWAKHQDFTVFVAIDYSKVPFEVVGFLRFQGINYTQAVRELVYFSREFKKVDLVKHDRTGVGEALDEMLGATSLAFDGIVLNNSNKSSLINTLILTIERENIRLPYWQQLLIEMDAYEVKVSEAGNMKYSAPQGEHDDIVISLSLAVSAAEEHSVRAVEINFLEDLPTSELSIDSYYDDIADSDADDLVQSIFGWTVPPKGDD